MPAEKLPKHLRPSRVHFDNLPERIQAATHAGVKGKHLRAVTILGALLSFAPANDASLCNPMSRQVRGGRCYC